MKTILFLSLVFGCNLIANAHQTVKSSDIDNLHFGDSIHYDLVDASKISAINLTGSLWDFSNIKYWVGPFYEDLIQSPFGFSISSGYIYKVAASENVYMFDKHMKSKDTISICYAVRDSVPIVNSENASDTMFINKTPFINYTKRARMYKRHRDSVWVNYQPDTLVMPKIKRDTLIEK